MKRLSRMLGVTLLEIMLVLAIASMIIVMSIRYYTSANLAQQSNAIFQLVVALSAAADNLAVGAGSYSSVTAPMLKSAVGAYNFGSGGTSLVATLAVDTTAKSTIQFTLTGIPVGTCDAIGAKLASGKPGSHYSAVSCETAGSLIYKYSFNPAPSVNPTT